MAMPLSTPSTKDNHKSFARKRWKEEYLRILNGSVTDDGFELAAELERDGYIRVRLERTLADRQPNTGRVVFQGLTTKGRLFADELQEQLYRQSRAYRFVWWRDQSLAWLAGVLTAAVAELIIALITGA